MSPAPTPGECPLRGQLPQQPSQSQPPDPRLPARRVEWSRGTRAPSSPCQRTPSVAHGPAGGSSSKPPASRNPHGQMQALTHESSVHPIPGAASPAPPGIFAPHTPLPAWKAARKRVFEDSKGPFSLGDTLNLVLIGLGITLPPSSHQELLWEGQQRRSCPIKMVEAHGK